MPTPKARISATLRCFAGVVESIVFDRRSTSTDASGAGEARLTTLRRTGMPSSPAPMTRMFREGALEAVADIGVSFLWSPNGWAPIMSASVKFDTSVNVNSGCGEGMAEG